MKISSRTLLAVAMMAALPVGSALACTVDAWTNTGATTFTADDSNTGGPTANPATSIARYSGKCALSVADGQYVIANHNADHGVYRARFYVFPGATNGGTATIFQANDADDAGGAATIEVTYDGSAFGFSTNGNPHDTVTAAPGKWYSVEMFYKTGEEFSAQVRGGGSDDLVDDPVSSAAPGAGTVRSSFLGVEDAAGADKFNFDDFVATQSEADPIGRLCRGDVNDDGERDVLDAVVIRNEFTSFSQLLADGQPDINEDGVIDLLDAIVVKNLFLNFQGACPSPF